MNPLTRRKLFAATAALPFAALAQEASKISSVDDDLKNARDAIANNAALLAKVEVPIATEPAFVFKA